MKYTFLILLVITASCTSKAKDPIVEKIKELDTKAQVYSGLISQMQSVDGWISADECDAVTFNALAAASGIEGIDIFAAEDDGKWYRTPRMACLEEGRSKSSCSRDNYLMLLHYLWTLQDLDAIERMIQHGESSNWIVCDHDGSVDGKSRVYITPSLQALIYQARYKLGGADHGKRKVGQIWGKARGFQAHLQVMVVHMLGRMNGEITRTARDILQAHRDRNPDNALFQALASRYGDGDMMNAVGILLNETYFPADRLPSANEYCTDYLFEREQFGLFAQQAYQGEDLKMVLEDEELEDDWKPCPGKAKHYQGIDWMTAYAVVIGRL